MHSEKTSSIAEPTLSLRVNGTLISVPRGTTVAAALTQAGLSTRTSVSGELRSPLCAMGVCMECCAEVNNRHVRTCQILVEQDMEVVTR